MPASTRQPGTPVRGVLGGAPSDAAPVEVVALATPADRRARLRSPLNEMDDDLLDDGEKGKDKHSVNPFRQPDVSGAKPPSWTRSL